MVQNGHGADNDDAVLLRFVMPEQVDLGKPTTLSVLSLAYRNMSNIISLNMLPTLLPNFSNYREQPDDSMLLLCCLKADLNFS